MPGIESIQLFCEKQFCNFDAGAIRGMRAVVCGLQNLKISEADELPLEEVAHILDASKAKPATGTAEYATEPSSKPEFYKAGCEQLESASGMKAPGKDAMACYRVSIAFGKNQTQIAEQMI